jgi:tetratricopeptide (TPR) repeat protein
MIKEKLREKDFEDLVHDIRRAKERDGKGAIVFLGAGCSITANIPGTDEIIQKVLREYGDRRAVKQVWEEAMAKADQAAQQQGRAQASEKEIRRNVAYAKLMDLIGPSECAKIFKDIVEDAEVRINVSHIYLAQLVKQGYVDYILTTNFDNLAQRAMALYDLFPTIYDLPSLEKPGALSIHKQSITHLHGTYKGFWQLNSHAEMKKVIENGFAREIFSYIEEGRPWIVIGYSGEDPILKELASLKRFKNGLHWVGYRDEEPSDNVKKHLFSNPLSGAFWIKGYDSDKFFLKLNQALVAHEPEIIDQPFSFLKVLQDNIIDIREERDYLITKYRLAQAKDFVEDAIERYEAEVHGRLMEVAEIQAGKLTMKLVSLALSGKYKEAAQYEAEVMDSESLELHGTLAAVFNDWGNALSDLAETKTGSDAESLYLEAFEKFERTVQIIPDFHEPFLNWGTALVGLAMSKAGSEADVLYREAFEKFAHAFEINPEFHEAFYNWGNALKYLARSKAGSEAETLYQEACEKYALAAEINPEFHLTFNNWGNALMDLAEAKSGSEAAPLYREACEKYARTVKIKPDDHQAFYNWGSALVDLAKTKAGSEADTLYREGCEKYARATEIKPDYHEAFYNWGFALIRLAKTKLGSEAETLCREGCEKYARAIEIKPDDHEAFYNWGNALMDLAEAKSGSEAEPVYRETCEKYARAVGIKPDYHDAFINWGNALKNLAKTKSGSDADALYREACEKYARAAGIKPDFHGAFQNWGYILIQWARLKTGDQRLETLREAKDKIEKAVALGSSPYFLACCHALLGQKEQALELLARCLEQGSIKFDHVALDADWDGLRDEPGYLALQAQYGGREE